jgi:hypothetical protein
MFHALALIMGNADKIYDSARPASYEQLQRSNCDLVRLLRQPNDELVFLRQSLKVVGQFRHDVPKQQSAGS